MLHRKKATQTVVGLLTVAIVGLRGMFSAFGDVGTFLAFLPPPVAKFITTPEGTLFLVVVGFGLLWWAVRHPIDSTTPRLIFDIDRTNNDHPYFLRNDGADTALDIAIGPVMLGEQLFMFSPNGSHCAAGQHVGVKIYRRGQRIDTAIAPALAYTLQALPKPDETSFDVTLGVTIRYSDHEKKQYSSRFDILMAALRHADGTYGVGSARIKVGDPAWPSGTFSTDASRRRLA